MTTDHTMIRLTLSEEEQARLDDALEAMPGWPLAKALRFLLGRALDERHVDARTSTPRRPALRVDERLLDILTEMATREETEVAVLVKDLIMSAIRSD